MGERALVTGGAEFLGSHLCEGLLDAHNGVICVVNALEGEDIKIYGDGSQTRSFCYVDDMVTALMRLMSTEKTIDHFASILED